MPVIETDLLTPSDLAGERGHQIYNGLDCCVTFEVWEALRSLTNQDPITYNFERALQAPALEMMLRGFRLDHRSRREGIATLTLELARLDKILQRYAYAIWEKPLNPRSPKQLIDFFYGSLKLPEQWLSQKGQKKLSTNRETLEKLELYFIARPIIACILAIRDTGKRLQVLETEVDQDGRMRTSYNIAGTETGRWSSSANSTGGGTNLQNITPGLRYIFVSDPGWKLCGIDLEQAESREVAWLCGTLFGDWSYLDACTGGDLHTTTCKLIWPTQLPWTGDSGKDKALAESPFYRHYSYRDMSKRGGHGCLTADHEVLTPNGWVSIETMPTTIMTWSPKKSEFTQVTNWVDKIYEGEFQSFEGNSVSLCATHDHRVPFLKDQAGHLHVQAAEEGPGKLMPLGDHWVGGTQEVPAKLIAAFMSDGHQNSPNRMAFHLHKGRKWERLVQLCEKYGFVYREDTVNSKIWIEGSLPKTPGAFMFNWTRRCLQEFLTEYHHWDGHKSLTAICLFSKNRKDLEWIQTFGRICGIGGNIQKPQVSGFGTLVYKLQQNQRRYASGCSIKWTKNKGAALVYCPTVPSSYFYIRRNGKISVTGNSNYYGTPFTMARHLKVPTKFMEDFQKAYFSAFPGIPKWHRYVAQELQTKQKLTSVFGRERHFFGRPNDDTTLREAIAYCPQSATGDRMNLGLWKIWNSMRDKVQLLAQVHDAVYFQFRETEDEAAIIKEALSLIEIETRDEKTGRSYLVPGEAKTGWNWGNYDPKKNPEGLKKFKGPDTRSRTTILDRVYNE